MLMLAYVSWTRNVCFAFPLTAINKLKPLTATNTDSQTTGDGVHNVQRSVQQLVAGKRHRPAIAYSSVMWTVFSMAEQLFYRSPTR